jgi:two-component system chemotaxis response regulator CheB
MLDLGKLIVTEKLIQYKLKSDEVLIWKDSGRTEAWLWNQKSPAPWEWFKGRDALKFIGSYEKIQDLLGGKPVPPGSKIIGIRGECEVQLDTNERIVRFSGQRIKRVLIVDDSGTIRKILKRIISQIGEGWEVVGECEDAESVPEAILKYRPDIVTMDLHLKKMNGADAVKLYLGPQRIPTILISSQPKEDGGLVMEALSNGAFDYIQKPESGQWEEMKEDLHMKMDAGVKSNLRKVEITKAKTLLAEDFRPEEWLIVIGSSTGGTQALQEILTRLPPKIPAIMIAQHIPAGFSKALAERLDKLCPFTVKEAEDGDDVVPGKVLIAPGSNHLRITKNGKKAEVYPGEPVNRFRPSVEVLFDSVRERSELKIISVMLTGMGKDGAEAMLRLHNEGAYCIAQDEETCVVFGMPKEAIRLGAADKVARLENIPEAIISFMVQSKKAKKAL